MKNFFRRLALGALTWAFNRSAKNAAKQLAWSVAWAAFGYWAGRSGFGSSIYVHSDAHLMAFFRNVAAPTAAFAFPAARYTNGFVTAFLSSRAVNPFLFGLFALPLYLVAFVATFVLWGLWTFPFFILWQFVVLALVAARPLIQRKASAIAGDATADAAAAIVRDFAKSATARP